MGQGVEPRGRAPSLVVIGACCMAVSGIFSSFAVRSSLVVVVVM